MARQPERRRFRSDDELREQRKQLLRAWQAHQRRTARQHARDNAAERTARIDRLVHEHRLDADSQRAISTAPLHDIVRVVVKPGAVAAREPRPSARRKRS
jgi:hypothetical protein